MPVRCSNQAQATSGQHSRADRRRDSGGSIRASCRRRPACERHGWRPHGRRSSRRCPVTSCAERCSSVSRSRHRPRCWRSCRSTRSGSTQTSRRISCASLAHRPAGGSRPPTCTASHVTYHGKVLGLNAGTGSALAVLPAQNASGNWIKIVQRLPVRIGLDPAELAAASSVPWTVDGGPRGCPRSQAAPPCPSGRFGRLRSDTMRLCQSDVGRRS